VQKRQRIAPPLAQIGAMRLSPFAPYDAVRMPNYRRAFISGGCWFFTVNLLDRRSRLLVDHIDALREAVRATMERHPFRIDAMVVLPNHMHAVWTLPDEDHDFPDALAPHQDSVLQIHPQGGAPH
jgi:REP element-mobilizing transposase RayT